MLLGGGKEPGSFENVRVCLNNVAPVDLQICFVKRESRLVGCRALGVLDGNIVFLAIISARKSVANGAMESSGFAARPRSRSKSRARVAPPERREPAALSPGLVPPESDPRIPHSYCCKNCGFSNYLALVETQRQLDEGAAAEAMGAAGSFVRQLRNTEMEQQRKIEVARLYAVLDVKDQQHRHRVLLSDFKEKVQTVTSEDLDALPGRVWPNPWSDVFWKSRLPLRSEQISSCYGPV